MAHADLWARTCTPVRPATGRVETETRPSEPFLVRMSGSSPKLTAGVFSRLIADDRQNALRGRCPCSLRARTPPAPIQEVASEAAAPGEPVARNPCLARKASGVPKPKLSNGLPPKRAWAALLPNAAHACCTFCTLLHDFGCCKEGYHVALRR